MTMTISAGKVVYRPDGMTTEFAVPFRFFQASDLVVERVNGRERSPVSTGYTVQGVNAPEGGSIVFSVAPAGPQPLVIRRLTPHTQESAYPEGGRFPAATVENDLDRVVAQLQELQDGLDLAVKAPLDGSQSQEDFSADLFTARDLAQSAAQEALRQKQLAQTARSGAESALAETRSAAAQALSDVHSAAEAESQRLGQEADSAIAQAGAAATASAASAAAAQGSAAQAAAQVLAAQVWAEGADNVSPDPADPEARSAKYWASQAEAVVSEGSVPMLRAIATEAPLTGGGTLQENRVLRLDTVPVAKGGTGATTAAGALTSLSAVPAARTLSTTAPLSGGGDLSVNRTLSVAAATTEAAGVVKLNNTLTSTSTTEALTAAQGKVLNDAISSAGGSGVALLTTSGSWTAPKTGTYKVTIVGGGGNGTANGNGGTAGMVVSNIWNFTAGQVFPYTIGAANGATIFNGVSVSTVYNGTYGNLGGFGSDSANDRWGKGVGAGPMHLTAGNRVLNPGGGGGFHYGRHLQGTIFGGSGYGAGGGAYAANPDSGYQGAGGIGVQGCILIEW